MQIETRKIVENNYILNEQDAKTFRACLDYCWHRATKHNKPSHGIKADELQRLREEFGIVRKEEKELCGICGELRFDCGFPCNLRSIE